MERISGKIPAICLEGVRHEFSTEIQETWNAVSCRPSGEIELLVGSEVASLHPVAHETRGDMVVLKSQFGSGWAIYGSHERLDSQHVEFSEDIGAIRQGGFKVLECGKISYEPNITLRESRELWRDAVKKVGVCASMPKDFFSIEDLGVEPPRRCKDCKDCQKCSWRGMMQSEKEAEEYRMIEEGVHYSQETGRFTITYPFIDDPYKLGNNLGQVIKIADKLERKLEKQGFREEVNEAFDKMVEAGALRELTQMEMDRWKGPVHYVSIQHVLNLASTTTKHRLVTNTSLRDPSSGLSVNDILAKGPNCLSDAYELLIRFRSYKRGLIADISKAYHQLSVGEVESHMRRVVWRRSRSSRLQIYAFMVVSFGDRPAAVVLEVAIKMTIQMFGDVDKMAAHRLEFDRFVDDLASGGNADEVARFVGTEDEETNLCNGTMPQILGGGGFKLKAMAWSGEKDGDKLKKLGSAVLGQQFSTEDDTLAVVLGANISKRRRGEPTGPDLTPENLEELKECQLTRRICLSISNSIYDVLGICAPITIQLKLGIKKLFSEEYKLGWDTIISPELSAVWKGLIIMLVKAKRVEYPRCTIPHNAQGEWCAVAFFDGSEQAFSCVIYAVWQLPSGGADVKFLASKAKVAPDWSKNTPRMELCGAVLATRLVVRVVRAVTEKPEKVYIVGDSETILAAREKNSGYFNEYFSNRVGETWDNQKKIEEYCQVGDNDREWYHVASHLNPADKPSRCGSQPEDVQLGSTWQVGPEYLRLPREEWPIERDYSSRKGKIRVPKEEVAKKYRNMMPQDIRAISFEEMENLESVQSCMVTKNKDYSVLLPEDEENPIVSHFKGGHNTNSWEKLLRMTGTLFRWMVKVLQKKGDKIVTERELAVKFWVRVAMPATREAKEQGKLKRLTLWEHENLLVVSGRAEAGLKKYFGVHFLPVLMASTRTAQLIMLWGHEQDHSNRDTTLITATQVAWIVGGRKLAGKIKDLCVRCRFLDKKLVGQKMAVLPQELTIPCPPFTNLGVDLAGPVRIKITGGEKTTRNNKGTFKGWVVVIVCLNTKAVKLYLACGYATKDFLLAWEQHVSDCGNPLTVHSDRGSQLSRASKEVMEDRPDFDWEIIASTDLGRTVWRFCPSGAQFRNGATESYVKKVKRSLIHTYGERNLNQQEFTTAIKRVACVLNSRPIYAMMGPKGGADPDYLCGLTPNMLITGRTHTDVPSKEYDNTSDPRGRLEYITELEKLWWGQHKVQDFSSLVPTQKWTEVKRNMKVGDVVLIQYSSISKAGDYRLGRVVAIEIDGDQLVRTCVVKYSLVQNMTKADRLQYKGITVKYLRTAVQRLVLIVPYEEQQQWPDVTNEEKDIAHGIIVAAKADINKDHEACKNCHEVQKVRQTHMIKDMLKARGLFDDVVTEVFKNSWSLVELEEGGSSVGEYGNLIVQATGSKVLEVRDLVERSYIFSLSQEF